MILFLIQLLVDKTYICGNDLFPLKISTPKTILSENPSYYQPETRVPINIEFDLDAIYSKIDPMECHSINQSINWRFGNLICEEKHLMNEKRITVLKETLDNLKIFFNKLLKINRFEKYILLNWTTELNEEIKMPSTKLISNSDLHVLIVARPFAANAGASVAAHPAALSKIDSRPNQGMLFINPEGIPDESEDHIKIEHLFFKVLFHELVHILGMEPTLYKNWINPENGQHWGNSLPLIHYNNPKYPNKTFHILATKASKNFAIKRWNRNEFAPGIPMGIELEDGGGEYTSLSHPESRIYFNEVMVGMLNPPMLITDCVLSLLEDMGWYTVDFSLASPLTWGVVGLNEKKSDFPTEPAQLVFPKGYECSNDDLNWELICSHDFIAGAFCIPPSPVNCPGTSGSSDELFCKSQEFYNPLNLSTRGRSSVFDFIKLKSSMVGPNKFLFCNEESGKTGFHDDNSAIDYNMKFGKSSACTKIITQKSNLTRKMAGCYKMKCNNEKKKLIININNNEFKCEYEDQIINIGSNNIKNIYCPNPNIICNSGNIEIMNEIINEKINNKLFYYSIGIILILILIFIIYKLLFNSNSNFSNFDDNLKV